MFGRRDDDESRIRDPGDATRVFRWLLEASFDRLGNAMQVRYRPEDAAGVHAGSHDARRFVGAIANRYPDRIHYGNAAARSVDDSLEDVRWHFEAVFDYGDYDRAAPRPSPDGSWPVREDVGFTGRGGFELRTRRLLPPGVDVSPLRGGAR